MARPARPSFDERAREAHDAGVDSVLVVELGYRGAPFAGFAAQPGLKTVEGELVSALTTLLKREPDASCAGRTDAGVHALAQYLSVPLAEGELELSGRRIRLALDAMTDPAISIKRILRAPAGFSARFDALWRSYRYRIADGPSRPVMAAEHAWWLSRELDEAAMDAAGRALVGEHDFRSFCKAEAAEGRSTVREVLDLHVSRIEEAGEELVALDVRGSAFLHSMVRVICGTLVEVGLGRRSVAWPGEVLAACDRAAAAQTAPAQGLCLCEVGYPEGLLNDWDA